ncbi:MAG TPA: hotdog domain-containing protein, partial [Rhodanobacteraceae bacterium]|nr:hotdog domain-containing protein [Rhodanobacteraceae bacterium]
VFVVHAIDVRFNAPARLDDLLTATVALLECRSASFVVRQELRREPEARALVEARVRIACLDASSFRPRPIPDHLLDVIAKP